MWNGLNRATGRPWAGRIAGLCAATALTLAACGGSSTDGGTGVASLGASGDAAAEASADAESAPSTEPKTEEELAADQDKAFEDYEKCVEDLGIDASVFFGQGGPGGQSGGATVEAEASGDEADESSDAAFLGGITEEQFERMEEECDPILAAIVNDFELSPEEQAEFRDTELKFAQCMRENGVDLPDPAAQGANVDGESGGVDTGFEIAEGDFEKFEQAIEVCDKIFEDAFAAEDES